jgi:peptidoglycan hydrolase-like protein with peptidoglycan-binding domain
MSVNDPYWRLFETPSVPAPAYDRAEDLSAVLANLTPAYGNADSGAISPAADPLSSAQRAGIPLDTIARAAEAAATPEPMIALVPPLGSDSIAGPAAGQMLAYRLPRAAVPASAGFEPKMIEPDTDLVVAFAPMPQPVALRDPGAGALAQGVSGQTQGPFNAPAAPAQPRIANSGFTEDAQALTGRVDLRYRLALAGIEPEPDLVIAFAPMPLPEALHDLGESAFAEAVFGPALNPFDAPDAPSQPRIAASELTEESLALGRHRRVDVQRRLALAGFDPKGLDGTFGPQTRTAIADFQTAWNFPATGYLEAEVYADLNQRTESAYQALRRQAAAAPSAAPALAPIARERRLASADEDILCARRSDGRIIERQSLACDLTGFGEQFVSLGRNTLNGEDDDEDGGIVEIAARIPRAASAGADR